MITLEDGTMLKIDWPYGHSPERGDIQVSYGDGWEDIPEAKVIGT